jgi:hypothetical protein
VQFNPAATTGTSTGAGVGGSSGGSTGPFSGAPQLTVTISARMFETPGTPLSAVGTGTVAGAIPAAGTTKAASSTLNNS